MGDFREDLIFKKTVLLSLIVSQPDFQISQSKPTYSRKSFLIVEAHENIRNIKNN